MKSSTARGKPKLINRLRHVPGLRCTHTPYSHETLGLSCRANHQAPGTSLLRHHDASFPCGMSYILWGGIYSHQSLEVYHAFFSDMIIIGKVREREEPLIDGDSRFEPHLPPSPPRPRHRVLPRLKVCSTLPVTHTKRRSESRVQLCR